MARECLRHYGEQVLERVVNKYLIRQGRVAPSRIKAIGYGETKPLYRKKTKWARDRNNRIEIHIVKVKLKDCRPPAPRPALEHGG